MREQIVLLLSVLSLEPFKGSNQKTKGEMKMRKMEEEIYVGDYVEIRPSYRQDSDLLEDLEGTEPPYKVERIEDDLLWLEGSDCSVSITEVKKVNLERSTKIEPGDRVCLKEDNLRHNLVRELEGEEPPYLVEEVFQDWICIKGSDIMVSYDEVALATKAGQSIDIEEDIRDLMYNQQIVLIALKRMEKIKGRLMQHESGRYIIKNMVRTENSYRTIRKNLAKEYHYLLQRID